MPITQPHEPTYTGVPQGEPEVLFSADSPPSSSDTLLTPDEDEHDDSDSISEKSWKSLSEVHSEHDEIESEISEDNDPDAILSSDPEGDTQPPDYETATSTSPTTSDPSSSNIDVEAQTPSKAEDSESPWRNFADALGFCVMLAVLAGFAVMFFWAIYNIFGVVLSILGGGKGVRVPATTQDAGVVVPAYSTVEGGDVDAWLREFELSVAGQDAVPVTVEMVPLEPALPAVPIVEEKKEEEVVPVTEEKPEEERAPVAEEKPEGEKEPVAEEKPEEEKVTAAEENPEGGKEPVAEEKTEEEKEPVVEEKKEESNVQVIEEKPEEPKPAEEGVVQVSEDQKIVEEKMEESKQIEEALAQVIEEQRIEEEIYAENNEDENAHKSNGGILGAVAAGVSWIFNGVGSILGKIFGR